MSLSEDGDLGVGGTGESKLLFTEFYDVSCTLDNLFNHETLSFLQAGIPTLKVKQLRLREVRRLVKIIQPCKRLGWSLGLCVHKAQVHLTIS